jgi:hypothetical protein
MDCTEDWTSNLNGVKQLLDEASADPEQPDRGLPGPLTEEAVKQQQRHLETTTSPALVPPPAVPPPPVNAAATAKPPATKQASTPDSIGSTSGATGSTPRAEPGAMEAPEAGGSTGCATRAKEFLRAGADKKDAGETSLPKKDKEGHYHVEGDLIVCSKSAQYALFKVLTPLFDTACSKTCVLLSPIPRYLKEGCCRQVDHMPNRANNNFSQQLLDDLKEVTGNLHDFCFTSTFKAMKILDPQVSWKGTSSEEVWASDPVHPTAEGYAKLAAGVEAICLSIESGAKKLARSNSFETGDGPSGLHNRQRAYGPTSSGQQRGSGPPRGRPRRPIQQGPKLRPHTTDIPYFEIRLPFGIIFHFL